MPKQKLPHKLHKYFWDIDTDKLNTQQRSIYIIERLLEQGNTESIKWLLNTYTKSQLTKTLKISRKISTKMTNFWSMIHDIPKEEIKCLEKSYREQHKQIWAC